MQLERSFTASSTCCKCSYTFIFSASPLIPPLVPLGRSFCLHLVVFLAAFFSVSTHMVLFTLMPLRPPPCSFTFLFPSTLTSRSWFRNRCLLSSHLFRPLKFATALRIQTSGSDVFARGTDKMRANYEVGCRSKASTSLRHVCANRR